MIILLVEDFPFSLIQTFRMLTAIDKYCGGIYSAILGLQYMLWWTKIQEPYVYHQTEEFRGNVK